MATVVLEQAFDQPMRLDELVKVEEQAAWCCQQYNVRHTASLLSLDGFRLTCFFEAPDAEALRNVARLTNSPYEHLWSGTIHLPPGLPPTSLPSLAPALVVVERAFDTPANFDDIQATQGRSARCLEEHRVRFERTYLSLDQRRMLCLYTAPDAESVRLAQTKAGLPLERVWAAQTYQPS